ncbi:MAG: TIGR00269 family protein [Candidatus Hecatellales archaeon]|nr:MAG: TIGR00269 family protein [Candidatus Hecatellales archaeon]
MARCRLCGSEAEHYLPYARLWICSRCFVERFFPNRIRRTVEAYKMLEGSEKVAVAVSGGKDSAALLHSLKEAFPTLRLIAIHLNLGIQGYSEEAQRSVEELCRSLNVELEVYDLKAEEGFTIGDFKATRYGRKLCAVCGVVKRRRLAKIAGRLGVDALATGHNLDDTVESLLAAFTGGDFQQLVRLKPVLPAQPPFPKKIKPFHRTPEREALLYAEILGLPFNRRRCPHVSGSRSLRGKSLLDLWEAEEPGFKYRLLAAFERLIPLLEPSVAQPEYTYCRVCGLPSSQPLCADCKRIEALKRVLNRGQN